MSSTVVAIDGPSASGKSSTAVAVAEGLGFRHLDSGALYRGLTLVAIRAGLPSPYDEGDILRAAEEVGLELRPVLGSFQVVLEASGEILAEELRTADVTARVSEVAALPAIRDWVNRHLRSAAVSGGAVVVDGRDIGSVVFPEAELKVFLTASPAARAQRRLVQRGDQVDQAWLTAETDALAARDRADSHRAVAPLIQAPDAVLLDTSEMGFVEQVDRIVALARERGITPGP
ncbi:MAG: (d)CMP kinase [Longimicrobiales bacterium]